MFASELVNTPLKRLTKTEIIRMKRQHFLALNGVKDPVRQLDFNPEQAAVKAMLAPDRGRVNQAEAIRLLFIARADVRGDAGSGEAFNRLAQCVIVLSRRPPIRKNQEIITGYAYARAHL